MKKFETPEIEITVLNTEETTATDVTSGENEDV